MIVALSFPHKDLWPNGRAHRHAEARHKAKAKEEAFWATKALPTPTLPPAPIPVALTVYPKRFGPPPDRDNASAAIKAHLDGIAQALGVNDRDFAAPTVTFGPRESRIEISIGLWMKSTPAECGADSASPINGLPL